METGQVPLVNTAAHLAKSVIYNNREKFMASLMVAGWDKVKGGQVGFFIKVEWIIYYIKQKE